MNVVGDVPSLKVTVYVVVGGLEEKSDILNVSELSEQIVVLPFVPKLIAGLLPTNTL